MSVMRRVAQAAQENLEVKHVAAFGLLVAFVLTFFQPAGGAALAIGLLALYGLYRASERMFNNHRSVAYMVPAKVSVRLDR